MKRFMPAALFALICSCAGPARSTFATNGLSEGALVEIECMASVGHPE